MSSLDGIALVADTTTYTAWDACVATIVSWSIKDKFHFRRPCSNNDRKDFVCHAEQCKWKCLARRSADGIITMRVIEREHTCISDVKRKRPSITDQNFLDEQVSRHLRISATTTPKDIQDTISLHFSENLGYHRAFECLKRLRNDDLGEQRLSFELLPAYRKALLAVDPNAVVDLVIDPVSSRSVTLLRRSFRLTLQKTSNAASFVLRFRAQYSRFVDL